MKFFDGYNHLNKVRPLMEQIAENGLLYKIFEIISFNVSGASQNPIAQTSLINILRSMGMLCKYSATLAS
jgi:hypothetical protein